jgi:hypothetical protein
MMLHLTNYCTESLDRDEIEGTGLWDNRYRVHNGLICACDEVLFHEIGAAEGLFRLK